MIKLIIFLLFLCVIYGVCKSPSERRKMDREMKKWMRGCDKADRYLKKTMNGGKRGRKGGF